MKHVLVWAIFALVLCGGPCWTAGAIQDEEVIRTGSEEEGEGDLRPIDVSEDGGHGGLVDSEYGVDDPPMVPPGDFYDENTGLPNVTESDTAGEIE